MTQNRLPKYIQVKLHIQNQVIDGTIKPGDQIPTENELAEMYGVSRQTVRQAITELVHERLLIRQQGKGTFVATYPYSSGEDDPSSPADTHIIGVITTYLSDYIFPSIIRGIESELSEHGYSILLFSTHNTFHQEARALETVMKKHVDGLIVEPTKSTLPNPNLHMYFRLLEKSIPLVTMHTSFQELGTPCVRIDDAQGALLITEHLIEHGHTRIGGIFKSDDLQGRYRLNGFMRGLHSHGLTVPSEFVSLYTTEQRNDVAKRYATLLTSTAAHIRPTAVACYNDEIAIQLIKHLKAGGLRVPDDIAVAGFDDSQIAETAEVGLTSIRHPKFDMGVKAAQLVLESIRNRGKAPGGSMSDFIFPVELIERESTAGQVRRLPQAHHP
ncbi:MAG: GntR family transcriptional regulator [Alicyclobacillus sp.]|nr:GntR family transcriptional regulator [Alicyclobacillus sp.]